MGSIPIEEKFYLEKLNLYKNMKKKLYHNKSNSNKVDFQVSNRYPIKQKLISKLSYFKKQNKYSKLPYNKQKKKYFPTFFFLPFYRTWFVKYWKYNNKKRYFLYRFFFQSFNILNTTISRKKFIKKNSIKYKFLSNFCYLYISYNKKNLFINFSDILGNMYYKLSTGFFFKKSIRKSSYSFEVLFRKFNNWIVQYKFFLKKKKIYVSLKGNIRESRLKKQLITFFEQLFSLTKANKTLKNQTQRNWLQLNYFPIKAHNGVRKPSKARK
jgi:ribosomal protein S11